MIASDAEVPGVELAIDDLVDQQFLPGSPDERSSPSYVRSAVWFIGSNFYA
jgi:hypothetical protein